MLECLWDWWWGSCLPRILAVRHMLMDHLEIVRMTVSFSLWLFILFHVVSACGHGLQYGPFYFHVRNWLFGNGVFCVQDSQALIVRRVWKRLHSYLRYVGQRTTNDFVTENLFEQYQRRDQLAVHVVQFEELHAGWSSPLPVLLLLKA